MTRQKTKMARIAGRVPSKEERAPNWKRAQHGYNPLNIIDVYFCVEYYVDYY